MVVEDSPSRLSRAAGHGRPAAPVRLVHLGLGNFYRAHQAWYTEHAPDAADWGYAAFSGRGTALADLLGEQGGLYTLGTRGDEGDRFEIISSVTHAHAATDHDAWLSYFALPSVAAVTVTVTEAGYVRRFDGALDTADPVVTADLDALRRDRSAVVHTAPARLAAGLIARRRADAGPIALVPCDNVPGNGAMVARVVRDVIEMVEPSMRDWLADSVSIVTTMVDRITPRLASEDLRAVSLATGREDRCPVISESFTEWVLSGAFPAGRPDWAAAGATFTDQLEPFEHRKLWLLNGGHSLLAYLGAIRGHETVAEAVADDVCRGWLEQWWAVASAHLRQPHDEVSAYRQALLARFGNRRIRHLLAQIATDGSQKLPIRILPALKAERAAGRVPQGATRVLAAWVVHLRGSRSTVADVRAEALLPLAAGSLAEAVPLVLSALDPALGGDEAVVDIVVEQADELARMNRG